MIQVEQLTKRYGERTAIKDLTFHANRGEIVGFLGLNGAGKTTTMRILTGYMPPTAGGGRVAGFDLIAESIEVRKRVGYLPENVPLYPEMSVVQYLDFMAELRRIPKREDRVDEAMETVHIEDRAESFVGKTGTVTSWDGKAGQVQLESELWSAEVATESDKLSKGDRVEVVEVSGIRLKVRKK